MRAEFFDASLPALDAGPAGVGLVASAVVVVPVASPSSAEVALTTGAIGVVGVLDVGATLLELAGGDDEVVAPTSSLDVGQGAVEVQSPSVSIAGVVSSASGPVQLEDPPIEFVHVLVPPAAQAALHGPEVLAAWVSTVGPAALALEVPQVTGAACTSAGAAEAVLEGGPVELVGVVVDSRTTLEIGGVGIETWVPRMLPAVVAALATPPAASRSLSHPPSLAAALARPPEASRPSLSPPTVSAALAVPPSFVRRLAA